MFEHIKPHAQTHVILFGAVKRKLSQPLEDDMKRVNRESRDSNAKLRDQIIEELEKRILGEQRSSSVNTVSGGRPESNRSKF